MIKYNNSNINDWNFGDDNIIKVYKHGAVVFYKFDSESQQFKVCYAVVDDITQYSDRESSTFSERKSMPNCFPLRLRHLLSPFQDMWENRKVHVRKDPSSSSSSMDDS